MRSFSVSLNAGKPTCFWNFLINSFFFCFLEAPGIRPGRRLGNLHRMTKHELYSISSPVVSERDAKEGL